MNNIGLQKGGGGRGQSVGPLTRQSGVLGSIPGLATYFRFPVRFFKKGSCQLLAKIKAKFFMLSYCVWSDDVRFYILFSIFSVMAGQWMVANERLYTMESR